MRKRHVNSWKFRPEQFLILDGFAGGGGASTGIEMALGRSPDACFNHKAEALAMHEANHPWSRHYKADIREIEPLHVTHGKPVGLAWFSPDCTFFSKSRGGKPIRLHGKKVRGLAWVVVNWARKVRPRVIILENVEEFQDWCPVIKKLDSKGAPVLDEHGKPWYVPCPKRKGQTFRKWVRRLEALGGRVEWRELRACDYGAPTIRKRLFVIIRFDNEPIVWPEPTHGDPKSAEVRDGKRLPWRTAAEIIDWSLPCPSIFLTPEEARVVGVKRPLEENTMKRIFQGLKRYVLESSNPFVVYCNHKGETFRGYGPDDPSNTVTASRDAVGVVDPLLTPFVASPAHSKTTGRGKNHWSPGEPLPTQTTSNDKCVVAPVMTFAQHGGANRDPQAPMHTVTASNKDQNAIVMPVMMGSLPCPSPIAPYSVPRYGERPGQTPRSRSIEEPTPTIVPDGNGAVIVAPVLDAQYGNSAGVSVTDPSPTVMGGGGGKIAVVAPIMDTYHGARPDGTVYRSMELHEPLRTQDTSNRHALVEAFIAQHNTGVVGHHPAKPLSTITNRGTQQQVVEVKAASIVGCGGRAGQSPPTSMDKPLGTVTGKADKCLATAFLSEQRGSNKRGAGGDPEQPSKTIAAEGQHHAVVQVDAEPIPEFEDWMDVNAKFGGDFEQYQRIYGLDYELESAAYLSRQYTSNTGGRQGKPDVPLKTVTAANRHAAVKAFLAKYYGNEHNHQSCHEPMHTATTKERFGIVTVNEVEYAIVDIGMRMLSARELFNAQGFPLDYKIDVWCDDRRNDKGKPLKPGMLTKEAQVKCAGNSVCPQMAAALVAANCNWLKVDPATWPKERNRELGEYYVKQPKAKSAV